MKNSSKIAVRVLFGFLAAMAACTVLSRAAASVLVAQVEVKKPGRGKLAYIYEGTGSVVPKKEKKVFLWEGQQIEWASEQGSTVKKGKCLVKFRKEYLEKTIEKKESELKQLRLQEAEQQISARKPARVPVSDGAQRALADARNRAKKAQARAREAKACWEEYKKKEKKGETVDAARKQELKEAYLAAKAEEEAAGQEKAQAQTAYELAKKEDAAQDQNNENAQAAARINAQAAGEQVRAAKKELELLREYRKAKGKMLAEQDCTVLENHVQAGGISAGTEYLVLGYGGWKLKGEISREDRGKILQGFQVSLQFASGGKAEAKIEEVDISAGKSSGEEEKQADYVWYAALLDEAEQEAEKAKGTETFVWKTEQESEKEYEQVIPISALREELGGAYCLIVVEKEEMLGTLKVAKKVPVTVLEKDGKNAAITSELKKEDKVIVSSEKFVSGGDRVRIKE